MKKFVVIPLVVLSFGFISNLNAGDTVSFSNPKVNGVALDWCKTWATDCGKPAADYFCQSNGYAKAVLFKKENNIGYTKILKTGRLCNKDFCDSFKVITCKKSNYKRFVKPKYQGVALDWCYTWGSECGTKAANEYCKAKGYHKGALRFLKDNNVGHTKIMRTGQLCNANFCDTFKYIDCKK